MNRLLIFASLFVPICVFGQTYTTPVRVNLDKSLRADRAPMMHIDRSGNIYIAWVSGANGSGNGPISIAVSTNGGSTFTNQVVCADALCNSNFQRTAQFVLDSKGNIHIVWMGNRVNNQPDIWYTRSIDQGKNWSKPITIDDAGDSSKYAQDFPSIACDSSDNLYVSFLDMRMTQQKLANTPQLYFSNSTDGGITWSKNSRADVPPNGIGGTCECCSENIACTADGHLYIAYRSNINNVRDIWLARSYDKGVTWQPSLKIMTGDWNINECPVTGPHIALDDTEGAHIVWRDVRDDSGGIIHLYYAYVPNGSTQTPANIAFDADGAQGQNYPDIALYDHAKYRVTAYETANFGMRYLLDNANMMLVNNRPIQENGSSTKSFANVRFIADGSRYLAWQDDINDAGDIYFAKEISPLSAGVTIKADTKFSMYPNPVSKEHSTITIERPSNTPSTLIITDLLGREMAPQTQLNESTSTIKLPNLPSGTYFLNLESPTTTSKQMIVIE
jgi:hypothetical protein